MMFIKINSGWFWSRLKIKLATGWTLPQSLLTKRSGVWETVKGLFGVSVINGLSRWWLRNGVVDPVSGTSLAISNTAFVEMDGRVGLRLISGHYALVPNPNLGGGPWTINLWYYPVRYTTYHHLLTHEGNQVHFTLKLNVINGSPYLHVGGVNYGLTNQGLELMSWSMLTVVYDGSMLRIYINKQLQSQNVANITVPNARYYVGRGNDEEYSVGYQSDLMFYNRALSQTEINSLYTELR